MEKYTIKIEGSFANITFFVDDKEYYLTVPNDESLESAISSDLQNWVNMAIDETNKNRTTILTKYQFISRLTVQERIAIFELENTNAMVKMWLEMFKICDEIDLSNEETIQGIGMLSQFGILAQERIAELLKPL